MSGASSKGAGATRGQLVLVGVLAVILVCVIANNFRNAANEPSAAVAAPMAAAVVSNADSKPAPAGQSTAESNPFGEFAQNADWPEPSLDQLIQFDPLAPPAAIAAAEQAANPGDDGLAKLQQAQDAIIFVSGESRIARIGETEYHVGDAVGRFRITEISSAGIVLSEPQRASNDR